VLKRQRTRTLKFRRARVNSPPNDDAREAEYQELIQHFLDCEGHAVVTGGAGSGKTTAAINKAGVEIAAGLVHAHSTALFLSFANATIDRVSGAAAAQFDDTTRARLEVSTYHGFAWSILRSHGYLLGAPRALSILGPGEENAFRSGLGDPKADVDAEFRRLFTDFRQVPFDYFADLATEVLNANPALVRAYSEAHPVIFLDEFQDTTDSQWAMIQAFAGSSRLIALGDPEQRIYGHFRGASEHRFDEFSAALNPTSFDLSAWNWRSPEGSITAFGRDVLKGTVSGDYDAVKLVGIGHPPLSYLKWEVLAGLRRVQGTGGTVAILTPSNALSVQVYDYFREEQGPNLPRLALDINAEKDAAYAAAILLASLMELEGDDNQALALACDAMARYVLTKSAKRLSGASKTLAAQLGREATRLRADRGGNDLQITARLRKVVELQALRARSGSPFADYLTSITIATESEAPQLQAIGKSARMIRLLNRGSDLEASLAELWHSRRSYEGAGEAMRAAVVQYQMANSKGGSQNLVVMNIHRAKGKEFDEVFIYEQNYATFIHADDTDLSASRKNMNVAVTRAKKRVTILTPERNPSALFFSKPAT